MYALVLVRPAWLATSEMPRDVPAPLAAEIERLTDRMDQAFASCRERVRNCPTFAALPEHERAKIDRELFAVGLQMRWLQVIGIGRELTRQTPDNEQGWISWAYALRELGEFETARGCLQRACKMEPHWKKNALEDPDLEALWATL